MRKAVSCLVVLVLLAAAPSARAAQSVAAVLESNAVSCLYMLMNTYHRQLVTCQTPLNQDRQERFVNMNAAMEQYIRDNARFGSESIIANAKASAERAAQTLPVCTSLEFRGIRQEMLNFTTADTENQLYAVLENKTVLVTGSCF